MKQIEHERNNRIQASDYPTAMTPTITRNEIHGCSDGITTLGEIIPELVNLLLVPQLLQVKLGAKLRHSQQAANNKVIINFKRVALVYRDYKFGQGLSCFFPIQLQKAKH